MEAHRADTKVARDGSVTVHGVPFPAGQAVDVIVLPREQITFVEESYPLQGSVLDYEDPLDPIADEDWDALRPPP